MSLFEALPISDPDPPPPPPPKKKHKRNPRPRRGRGRGKGNGPRQDRFYLVSTELESRKLCVLNTSLSVLLQIIHGDAKVGDVNNY